MVTLHGFAFSNYYNIVKHVLMYKGIPFEEDLQWGDAEDYLAVSPLGKVPAITTEHGQHLSESFVCCDYLEEMYPEPALYPADVYERNRVRQIMKVSEFYLELQARRFIPFAFTQSDAPDAVKEEVRGMIERGVGALNRLCVFDPYVTGSEQTMADIYLTYVMFVVNVAGAPQLGWDVMGDIKGATAWHSMMCETEIGQKVAADQAANTPEFFAHLSERFGTEISLA